VPVQKSLLELPRGIYAASVVRQRTVTKGPGKDRTGGVAFRLSGGAKLPNLLKRWAIFASREDAREGSVTAIPFDPAE
jgi:hypothetical protein